MPFREGDRTEAFEGVVMIDRRPDEKRAKSVLCRFPDGAERFVSRAQCPADQEFPDEPGEVFDLEVSAWMVHIWETTPPEEPVVLQGVVVLRESHKFPDNPSLQVRLSDGSTHWIGLRAIDKNSPVSGEGDRGDLWVAPWLAAKKGWGGPRAEPGRPIGPGANVGDDARAGLGTSDPGEDDIPF